MASGIRVLVTGANRGLGLQWVRHLVDRGDRVIATARDTSKCAALKDLATRVGVDRLTVVPLDVACDASIAAFGEKIASLVGPGPGLDAVVHNAGVSSSTHPIESALLAKKADMLRCYTVNVCGPLLLTQALQSSLRRPAKVLVVSSNMGSIANTEAPQAGTPEARNWTSSPSYRASKAAVNMVVKCLSEEARAGAEGLSGIVFAAVHPGWVATDMGSAGGRNPPLTVEESVASMVDVLDKLVPEDSGKFLNLDGGQLPY
jgi:NAD(P)-dependent dehydrogenase (short-subunit alcohol dehydrogenase family)